MTASESTDIVIYEGPGGTVEVRLVGESVWLNQYQLAALFGRERSVVARHIKNIIKDNELDESSVCAKFAQTGTDGKIYQVDHYNLDLIISVGYRVKSKEGVRFRQWATKTLHQHLTRGYTLNRQRFEENARELEAALALIRKASSSSVLTTDQGRGLVDVISRYTQTFLLLQRYDDGLLAEPTGTAGGTLPDMADARARIAALSRI